MKIAVGTLLLLASAMAFAQRIPHIGLGGLGGGQDRREAREAQEAQQELQAVQDAQAPAQNVALADGTRDGDEQLTCEQMQAEVTSIMANPQVQAMMPNPQAAANQADAFARMQQMTEQMQANRPSIAGAMARGMAQSLNPFGAIGARRRAERQQAEIEAQIAQIQQIAGVQLGANGQVGDLQAAAPLMARSNRLHQLGQQKQCGWAGASPAVPAAPQAPQ